MKRQGMQLAEIAQTMGVTPAAVKYMIERAVLDNGRDDAEAERTLMLGELDDAKQKLWEVIRRRHYLFSPGGQQLFDREGNPAIDDGPLVAAVTALNRLNERRAKLLGLDAPARKVTITLDMIDAEIAELERQLAAKRHESELQPRPHPLRAIEGRVEPPSPGQAMA